MNEESDQVCSQKILLSEIRILKVAQFSETKAKLELSFLWKVSEKYEPEDTLQ